MKLKALAAELDIPFSGDADYEISKVAPLHKIGAGDISFFSDPKYQQFLDDASEGVVILSEKHQGLCKTNCLISKNPYASYARATQLLYPVSTQQGIDDTAVVDPSAQIHETAYIAAHCFIGAKAKIGAGTQIGPGSFIGEAAMIGENCLFHASVNVYHHCQIGDDVLIHSGSVIGCDGFGFANQDGSWIKIPQVGRVIVKSNVEIGACCTIDRGALEDTVINENIILDNQIHIAHNCTIGSGTALAAQTGMAGSTNIGKNVLAGGHCAFNGHIDIADGSQFNGVSMVIKTITEPGQAYSSGIPAEKVGEWRRMIVRLRQLDTMEKRLKKLEKALQETKSD